MKIESNSNSNDKYNNNNDDLKLIKVFRRMDCNLTKRNYKK